MPIGMMVRGRRDVRFGIIVPFRGAIQPSGHENAFVHARDCPAMIDIHGEEQVEYETREDETTGRLFATTLARTPTAEAERQEIMPRPLVLGWGPPPSIPLGPNTDVIEEQIHIMVVTTTGEERRLFFNRTVPLRIIVEAYAEMFTADMEGSLLVDGFQLGPETTAESAGIRNHSVLDQMDLPEPNNVDEGVPDPNEDAPNEPFSTMSTYYASSTLAEFEGEVEEEEESEFAGETLYPRLVSARDWMHSGMINLSHAVKAYQRTGASDGMEIIQEEINFALFNEEHAHWWTQEDTDTERKRHRLRSHDHRVDGRRK